MAEVLAL